MKLYYPLLSAIVFFIIPPDKALAQKLTEQDSVLIREIMHEKIYSASKREEEVFASPLSCFTITYDEIQRAGSTSIPEALRLIPGIIVREETNGVFDIHIRGFDNLIRFGETTRSNAALLIMVDNRPIFSNMIDGAFFESLSVDLNDVDRIEVIRGPTGVAFGPGAAMGAINIITKKNVEKVMLRGNVSYGRPSTMFGNISYGQRVNEKFDFIVSANFQDRDRFTKVQRRIEVNDGPQTIDIDYDDAFSDRWMALKKIGTNATINYSSTDNMQVGLTLGTQQAEVQRHSIANVNGTLFTTNELTSYYAALNTKVDQFSLRASFQSGKDDLSGGKFDRVQFAHKYDYNNIDAVAEYDFSFAGGSAHVVPGLSYQSQSISDEAYVNKEWTFFGGKSHTINTTSAYLRGDVILISALRLIGALRADKFSSPDKVTLAYEIAATVTIQKNYLFRLAMTGSGARSSAYLNYLDLDFRNSDEIVRSFKGNRDLDLFVNNVIEIGMRARPLPELGIDIEGFRQVGSDFSIQVSDPNRTSFEFINVPTKGIQTGVTFSLNFMPDERIQLKGFFTVQETKIKKLTTGNGSYFDSRNLVTPPMYGGYTIHIAPSKKFNFNINGYLCTEEDKYDKKPIHALNLKASYSPIPAVNLYISGRNILAKEFFEYKEADKIQKLILAGVSFTLN